jgi:hypothetical protein
MKRIPIKALREFAQGLKLHQAILMAWDGERSHVVTWGKTLVDCDQAAHGGNLMKKTMGWPDATQTEPSRVRKLLARIKELEAELQVKR